MAKRKRAIPQYGTVVLNGIEYYRTRVEDSDGNRVALYRTPSGCVLPYAKSANDGLFCVRDYYRNGHTGTYTLVTPKGKLHFAGLRDLILVTV